jgi:hypothetical protein
MTMDNVMGPEHQGSENGAGQTTVAEGDEDQAQKVNAGVDRDECLDCPRKRRE